MIKKVTDKFNTTTKETYMICDCHCNRLFFSKTKWQWGDGTEDTDYSFSFVNDYLPGHTKPNIFQRIWRAIISKPTYYAETITDNKEQVLEFLHDCIDIIGEEDAGTQTK